MRLNREIDVINYKNTHKHQIMTTRFSNDTKSENDTYINNLNNSEIKCIYSSCLLVDSVAVQSRDIMFVLEMNNDTNKIMGIGMVRNCIPTTCYIHKIYKTEKHNMFSYSGKHHIKRDDMSHWEESIMSVLDILCFKGSRHQKRCTGITMFPVCMLQKCKSKGIYGMDLDITHFIGNMFNVRFFSKSVLPLPEVSKQL
jgi:ribosomal protein S13